MTQPQFNLTKTVLAPAALLQPAGASESAQTPPARKDLRQRKFRPAFLVVLPPRSMLPLRQLHWSLFPGAPTGHVPRIKSLRIGFPGRRRHASHSPSAFPFLVSQPSAEHQIYQSFSTDPYVNLSIENFLYKHTPTDSKILFLYVNSPTVVIGRNQNPWLETNLHLLNRAKAPKNVVEPSCTPVTLLRRRSGGGAVFHDEGNLNFSVICPKPIFHRDKHAEMVVRALHKLGAINTRVNTRHDIVMGGHSSAPVPQRVVHFDTDDVESPPVRATPQALKISGSAYKLSSFRALHHGTCLVDSPNLESIGAFLRSPARPYLHAKGVESVRSPIGNISSTLGGLSGSHLMQALVANIMEEFALLYKVDLDALFSAQKLRDRPGFQSGKNWLVGAVTANTSVGVNEIEEDIRDFKSLDWTYNQCPRFTFSTYPTEEDPRLRPGLPSNLHPSTRIFLRLKFGRIIESCISMSDDPETADFQSRRVHEVLQGRQLHEILDWRQALNGVADAFGSSQDVLDLSEWLNTKIGRRPS
uniref:Putative lipoate-protein ligase A n=1 Tax=Coccidioides posadasii RMSCC 3488 TaxID=454284 RepID=A0A0J6IN66_COCPO|nr:lipoate-protein ligase A [Coccidioides posadasii RMSCC 3488]